MLSCSLKSDKNKQSRLFLFKTGSGFQNWKLCVIVTNLCLLIFPFLFHLVESLQHPAKVRNTKVKADFFIVLLWCTNKQFPELGINFSFFLWGELSFSADNNTEKRNRVIYIFGDLQQYVFMTSKKRA